MHCIDWGFWQNVMAVLGSHCICIFLFISSNTYKYTKIYLMWVIITLPQTISVHVAFHLCLFKILLYLFLSAGKQHLISCTCVWSVLFPASCKEQFKGLAISSWPSIVLFLLWQIIMSSSDSYPRGDDSDVDAPVDLLTKEFPSVTILPQKSIARTRQNILSKPEHSSSSTIDGDQDSVGSDKYSDAEEELPSTRRAGLQQQEVGKLLEGSDIQVTSSVINHTFNALIMLHCIYRCI